MQKLVIGLIFLILLIGFIGVLYYRNSSKKDSKKVDNTDRSDLLTGLDSGGAGTTFVGGKDGEESIKMRDPSLLKNTIMSLKPLTPIGQNSYPYSIREGLFYIRMSGTNLYVGGRIHKDSGLGGLSFVTTDINLDRQEFQKNSLTSFTDNDGLKNRDSAIPILMDLVDGGKNDASREYTFTLRDIRQGKGNMKYIGIGNQNAYIVPGQKYVIIDLKSARMFFKDTNNLYTLATQWTKGNANDFYRTYMFENTGLDEVNDYGTSWYIYDTDSGKYLRRKPDGAVEAVSDKKCCGKETRWYLGWNQQNSNDGYHIRTAVNMDLLRFDNNNGIIVTVSPDKHDRAFGVFREEDFHWTVYKLNREINPIGGNNRWLWNDWGNQGIDANGILDGINKIGFNQPGGGTPFVCFSSQSGNLTGMRDGNNREKAGGQWICTNSKNLLQNTLTPVSSLLVTNGNADKYTFYMKNNKWYMRSGDKYLSWTYLKNNRVVYLTTNAASAVPLEFEPVLTKDMALRYLQASISALQEIRTRENRKSALSEFCGSSIMFKDGTLKVGTGLADQVATDDVTQAFERICACNMADNFYLQNTCSDQFIKDNYGITDVDQANAIRGTLKCTFSNCSFQKCRNLYNAVKNPETKLTLLADENATESSGCGSSTMCIVNQTINNSGNIVGGQLNMSSKQQCGGVGSGNAVISKTEDALEWIVPLGSQTVINNQGNVLGGNVNTQPYSQSSKEVTVYSEPNLSGTTKNLTLGNHTSEMIGFEVKSMKVPLGIAVEFKKNNTTNGIKFSNVFKSSFGNNIQEYEGINFPDLSQKNIIVVSTVDIYTPPSPPPIDPNETPEQYRARRDREQQEREQKEREQKEREQKTISDAITSVPQEISKITGFSGNFDDFSSEKNQTAEMCRQKAINSNGKYVAWGHRNENHPDPNYRNTCFLYKSPPFLKPNPPFTFTNDQVHSTGCLKEGDAAIYGCKSREEIGNKLKDLEVELFEQPNYASPLGKFKGGMLPPQAYGNKTIRSIKVPVGKKVNLVTNERDNPETQNLTKGNVPSININNIKFILIKDELYDLF